MKNLMMCLIVFLMSGCNLFKTIHQNDPQKYCVIDANTVITITKLVISQNEIRDLIFSYAGKTDTIYVANTFDPNVFELSSINNKCIIHDDVLICFYEYKELFFFGIMVWLEYESITINRNLIHAEFQIVVKHREKQTNQKKILKAVFECANKEIRIISLDL